MRQQRVGAARPQYRPPPAHNIPKLCFPGFGLFTAHVLSRLFTGRFPTPSRFPSLLNNRKLSRAKCQWPGRQRAGTGSGDVAGPEGSPRCSLNVARPPAARSHPRPRSTMVRVSPAPILPDWPWGEVGSCPQPVLPLTLASRPEQVGLTLS